MRTTRLARASLLTACLLIPSAVSRGQSGDSATLAGRRRAEATLPPGYANRIPAGAGVFTLDSTDIRASVGESFTAVLQARVPGLSVLRSGGSAAEGSRVQLRGPHSMYITTDPIVIVDGIRVNAMQESSIIDVGVRTSRLDDIAPEDIARVDVLPGPAAASLLGPGAAGGALVVTTKRGRPGFRWNGRAESRFGMKPGGFPANYWRQGISTATGRPALNCDLIAVAAGACTPTSLDVWNPLEQANPFRATRTTAGNLSLDGGARQTSLRVSASGQRRLGLTGDDDYGRLALRANVNQRVGDALDFGLYVADTRATAALPISGNFLGGVLTSGLFGAAVDDANHGFSPPYRSSDTRQRTTHWLGGITAGWHPTSWFWATGNVGRDHLNQHEVRGFRSPPGSPLPPTTEQRAGLVHTMTSSGVTAGFTYDIVPALSVRGQSTFGYDRLGSVLDGMDSTRSAWTRSHNEWVFSGPWMRQQVGWREQVIVGVGVRRQSRKAFGPTKPPSATFTSADATWSLGDIGPVHALRLRAAYGEGGVWMAGNPAQISVATPFEDDFSWADPVERTAESELGVDASWGDVATVALTAFRSDGSKLYVLTSSPPSNGTPSVMASPTGRMRNEGLALNAHTRLISRGAFRWDASLSAGWLRNRVRSFGMLGFIGIGTIARTQTGYPIASYWTRPYTYADVNRDGIIDTTEVTIGNEATFVGTSLPTREAGLQSTLALPGRLTAAILLDYRGGHKLADDNQRLRCTAYMNCRAAQDPTAPLEDQAAVAARRKAQFFGYPFVYDASFLKLRELSLTWKAPVGRTAITLAGRNLMTWTRYPGLDPEVDSRRFDELPRLELGKLPIVRELLVRLDIGESTRR